MPSRGRGCPAPPQPDPRAMMTLPIIGPVPGTLGGRVPRSSAEGRGWAFRREKREVGQSRGESESLMSGLETGSFWSHRGLWSMSFTPEGPPPSPARQTVWVLTRWRGVTSLVRSLLLGRRQFSREGVATSCHSQHSRDVHVTGRGGVCGMSGSLHAVGLGS